VRIPLAGQFGPGSSPGPGIPPEGSIGTVLGAGAISTDTRIGGAAGAAIAGASSSEWYKSPLALLAILVLAALFVRRVLE